MSAPLMRDGLRHVWSWSGNDAEFFARIDETGGWPVGYQFVGFEHSDERAAGFCNSPANSGWWTVIANADDYYLWKLSPAALQSVADAVRSAMTLPRVDATRLGIRNSSGRIAAIAKATGEAA